MHIMEFLIEAAAMWIKTETLLKDVKMKGV